MRRTPSITRRERMTPHASASSGTTGSGAKLAGLSPDEVAGAAAARRHQLPAPAHQHCDRTAMRALSDTVVSRVNDDHRALVSPETTSASWLFCRPSSNERAPRVSHSTIRASTR